MGFYDRPVTAVVDIDGVIAIGTIETVYSDKAKWAYEKCDPIPSGIAMVQELRAKGIRVVLFTARFPEDESATRRWLKTHNVPFNELIMGKPHGEIYIDDKGFHYQPGKSSLEEILKQMAEVRRKEFEEDLCNT